MRRTRIQRKRPNFKSAQRRADRMAEARRKRAMQPTLDNKLRVVAPQSMRVKLRYSYTNLATSTITNSVGVVFAINSLYDPEWLIGGNQPGGFDDLKLLYEKYKVYGCKVRLSAIPTSSSVGQEYILSLYADSDSTTLVSPYKWQQPTSKNRLLAYGNNPPLTISSYYKIADLFGQDINDDDFEASVTSNPVNIAYAHCSADQMNALALDVKIAFFVELTYYAIMFKPKQVSTN